MRAGTREAEPSMPTDENSVTIIARDAKFKGELILDQAAKIYGSVEGRIVSGGEMGGPSARPIPSARANGWIV